MKNSKLALYWIAVIVFVALGILIAQICFNQIPQSAFRDSFLGNLLATIIGIIAGIPIALWVSRSQQNEQEKIEKAFKESEEAEHTIKILSLVGKELEFNLKQLKKQKQGLSEHGERFLPIDGQKDELWNAFSDGGELQWIKDLQLLDIISMAYYDIRRVIHIEKLLLDAKRPQNYIADLVILRGKWLLEINQEVIESVELALNEINKVVEELKAKTHQKQRAG